MELDSLMMDSLVMEVLVALSSPNRVLPKKLAYISEDGKSTWIESAAVEVNMSLRSPNPDVPHVYFKISLNHPL